MAMQHLENELRKTGDPRDLERANTVASWLKERGSDLPSQTAAVRSTIKTPVETKNIIGAQSVFETPTVNEDLYLKTRESLAKEGYTFIVDIEPLSIGQLATGQATRKSFGYVNPSENMRAIAPQQMEVAINPNNLRIPNSNSKSTDTQIGMIQKEETALKGKLSQEVKDLINMRMQNASVLAQLDHKYQEETGEVLFTDWFGRTDDQTIPGNVADVGRLDPTGGLDVVDCRRGRGPGYVFAVPVVVLPRKLAV